MREFSWLLMLIHLLTFTLLGSDRVQNLGEPSGEWEVAIREYLAKGKEVEVNTLLDQVIASKIDLQRALFVKAVLLRARFTYNKSDDLFTQVASLGRDTPSGSCAGIVLGLDHNREITSGLSSLLKLTNDNPHDLFILLLLGVECRICGKMEEGTLIYGRLIDTWNPGPLILYQTYANLLSKLHRYDEAVVQRRRVVQQESTSWSMSPLAEDLTRLRKFTEANTIYETLVTGSKDNPSELNTVLESWEWSLIAQRNPEKAIAIANQILMLNPKDSFGWYHWGEALEMEGKEAEALEKYQKASSLNPSQPVYQKAVKGVGG